jgi:hypothetical protein
MNPLLGIAKITSNRKIRKFCAIQRSKQLNKKWANEKTTTVMVAIESFDLDWELQG